MDMRSWISSSFDRTAIHSTGRSLQSVRADLANDSSTRSGDATGGCASDCGAEKPISSRSPRVPFSFIDSRDLDRNCQHSSRSTVFQQYGRKFAVSGVAPNFVKLNGERR